MTAGMGQVFDVGLDIKNAADQLKSQLKDEYAAMLPEAIYDIGHGPRHGDEFVAVVITPTTTKKVTQSAAAKIQGKSKHPSFLTYPGDLDSIHYMQFHAVSIRKKSRSDRTQRTSLDTITLPIPANLQLQYATDYEETGIGIAGALISDQMDASVAIAGAEQGYKDIKGGIDSFTKRFNAGTTPQAPPGETVKEQTFMERLDSAAKNLKNQVMGAGVVGGVTLAGAAGIGVLGTAILGGDMIGGAIKGGFKKMGFITNPHLATIFTGVGKKSHNFNFKFVARSDDESGTIQDICATFRRNMLPQYKYGKFGLTYPHEWQINFSTETQPYLYNIGNCVLKSFNVTYNGGGVPVFHKGTNAPVEVDIQLSFTETFIETATDQGFGGSAQSLAGSAFRGTGIAF